MTKLGLPAAEMRFAAAATVKADEVVRLLSFAALLCLTIAGLALRVQKAWEDMTTLVVNTVPDDSFYYFQIARNITHGDGATLDGETVTNGFHPLWMAAILPFFAIDDRHLSVHLALTLGAVLGALTIPLIFDTIRRLTDSRLAGLLGAGFFALHPAIATYAVNGLETSIAMFTLAAFCWLFVVAARRAEAPSAGMYVALGFLGALMTLARTDTALVFVAVVGYLAFREWRAARSWRVAVVAPIVAFFVVLPWIVWSWAATGSPMQDSAVAGGTVFREGYIAANGDGLAVRIEHGWDEMRRTFVELLPWQFMVPLQHRVWPFWLAVAVMLGLIAALPTRRRAATLTGLGLVAVPLVGLLVALVYESGVRWFVRTWYYAPYGIFAAYGIGMVAFWLEGVALDGGDWLERQRRRGGGASRRRVSRWVVASGVYGVLILVLAVRYGPQEEDAELYGYPWQRALPGMSTWVATNTEADARIAAYNAGIPAYFWNRTVVNLDGVVNREAYEALRACDTRDYIREKDIDYVIDSGGQFHLTECTLSLEGDLDVVTEFGTDRFLRMIVAVPKSD